MGQDHRGLHEPRAAREITPPRRLHRAVPDLPDGGEEDVESRFSQNGCAPYDQVAPGDVVLLKRSGDEIIGLAHVSSVQHLTRRTDWGELRSRYEQQLCATEDTFWAEVKDADYATLMWFDIIRELPADRLRKT